LSLALAVVTLEFKAANGIEIIVNTETFLNVKQHKDILGGNEDRSERCVENGTSPSDSNVIFGSSHTEKLTFTRRITGHDLGELHRVAVSLTVSILVAIFIQFEFVKVVEVLDVITIKVIRAPPKTYPKFSPWTFPAPKLSLGRKSLPLLLVVSHDSPAAVTQTLESVRLMIVSFMVDLLLFGFVQLVLASLILQFDV